MRNIITILAAIAFASCNQKDEALNSVATINVYEIHATQEYDNYRNFVLGSLYSGTQIANYSELSPLLIQQFEAGYTYETIDENQFPNFPGAKEYLLALRKEWQAFQVLDEKFNFNSLSKTDLETIRSNYEDLRGGARDRLQPLISAHVLYLPTKE